jgi:hypothetical protein
VPLALFYLFYPLYPVQPTRELTGGQKRATETSDCRGPYPGRLVRRIHEEPVSRDGTIVANSSQLAGLFEDAATPVLNNERRQFAAKRLAPLSQRLSNFSL